MGNSESPDNRAQDLEVMVYPFNDVVDFLWEHVDPVHYQEPQLRKLDIINAFDAAQRAGQLIFMGNLQLGVLFMFRRRNAYEWEFHIYSDSHGLRMYLLGKECAKHVWNWVPAQRIVCVTRYPKAVSALKRLGFSLECVVKSGYVDTQVRDCYQLSLTKE